MLSSYFSIAFRHLLRYKSYTLINLLGFSLSLACCLFIGLWLQDELSIDHFHEKGQRTYRIFFNHKYPDGTISTWRNAYYPAEEALETQVPEVAHAVLMNHSEDLLSYQDQHIRDQGYFVSSDFFKVFSFPLLLGNEDKVLDDIHNVVISETMAARLFGEHWQAQNILGKTLLINRNEPLQISGVFADPPSHSTLQFDYLLSMDLNIKWYPWNKAFGNYNHQLFVLLHEESNVDEAQQKANTFIKEKSQNASDAPQVWFYPFEKLYLYGNIKGGVVVGGRIDYVQLFSVVMFLVLILACINYMNLSTARSSKRMKEIGVRKALGASRAALILQFIGESILITAASFAISLLIVQLLLPSFNQLTDKALIIDFYNLDYWLYALGMILLSGILSGSYPAFLLSSYRPVSILKGKFSSPYHALMLRKGLVIFQFILSMVLIAGTFMVEKQVGFIMNKNLGLDKENLVVFPLQGEAFQHHEAIMQMLLKEPNVVGITGANQAPLSVHSSNSSIEWEGKIEGQKVALSHMGIYYDFAKTFDIEMIEGREFSAAFASDSVNYILNEAAVKAMGLENPVGTKISNFMEEGQIIGVMKDFHNQLLYAPITPMIMYFATPPVLYVKTTAGKLQQTIVQLKSIHQQYSPEYPFEFMLPDQELNRLYRSEQVMSKLTTYFAMLAMVISCLGLLGLASFAAEQRTKEIGIRKAMGASVSSILIMLCKDYIKLIMIALLIAIPVANYFITEWLQNFAYRIEIRWWLFAVPGLLVLVTALFSVSGQTVKAANKNPVDSLRYE